MASDAVLNFTDDTFQADVLESDMPVLVDFWAEWCQPCKMLTPTIDEIAGEYAGRAKVGKMNIDDHKEVARRPRNIQSIPTVLIFKGGEVAQTFVGITPRTRSQRHSKQPCSMASLTDRITWRCQSRLQPDWSTWGRSSVGRAPAWHAGGRRFKPDRLHLQASSRPPRQSRGP